MTQLASFVWDADPVEHVSRAGGVVSTYSRVTEVVDVDFSALHRLPPKARLLSDFLADFNSDPALASHQEAAAEEVSILLKPDGVPTLADLRRARGLSQSELAVIMGVAQPMISQIEAGRRLPSLPTMRQFAAALGVDFNTLEKALPSG